MNLTFKPTAWEQYCYWQAQDKAVFKKINALLKECQRHPFEGSGKPEPLKTNLSGYWSRRINREHRLVYQVTSEAIIIVQCRYHY